jgi:hypothetical protein
MKRINYKFILLFLIPLAGILFSFRSIQNDHIDPKDFKTEFVMILVIDGPRFSETFGDSSCQYIPNLSKDLAPQGVLIKNFRNNGPTYTNAGHTAITTGVYQKIKNNGLEIPKNPGIFHYYLQQKKADSTTTWIIASKGKLSILGDAKDRKWNGKYQPSLYCGVDGKGEGYTPDIFNWRDAKRILAEYHPKLTLINMLEVDVRGHQNEWPEYLQAIRNTDKIAFELWNFIQSDSIYKDKTTLFITNDHGRHLNGRKDGFISHGDNCEGCRTMYLVALGPDFKQNTVLHDQYELIDISKTIAKMLQFEMPTADGEVMNDLFK